MARLRPTSTVAEAMADKSARQAGRILCCLGNLRLSWEPGVHRWHKCIPGSENAVNKLS